MPMYCTYVIILSTHIFYISVRAIELFCCSEEFLRLLIFMDDTNRVQWGLYPNF